MPPRDRDTLLRLPASELTPQERMAVFEDHEWRMSNLYKIIDKEGNEVTFVPNVQQHRLMKAMWWRNLIVKSRQMGYSTIIQLLMLDRCLIEPNTNAAVVAQDEDSATIIFRKIKFAYDRLPDEIKELRSLKRESASELMLANGSSLRVATSARSQTLQMLHISEYGKICAKYPDKAREIVTGSLPAAQTGIVFIESTAEGREGDFYEKTIKARALADAKKKLSRLEYRFHFAPWFEWPKYRLPADSAVITGVDHDYFNKIENVTGAKIDDEQRAWYVTTRDIEFGGDPQLMKQEYCSTADEPFEVSVDGVYYAEQMSAARRQDRICDLPYDPRVPVNTFWDLGLNDDTCIWFHQRIGTFEHFIDYYETNDAPFSTIVNAMQERGYVWGRHYLPHDGKHRRQGIDAIKTAEDMLHDLGLRNTEIVAVTPNVGVAIRQCKDAFPRYKFDRTKCAVGLNHMDHYRKTWSPRLGAWTDQPLKNGHQHAADALRQHAQQFDGEAQVTTGTRPKRRVSAMAV
jgi:hypothetical protein